MLHRAGAPSYGFNRPGFIGPLPLDNRSTATWAEFWWERRIEPFLRLALDAGALDADERGRSPSSRTRSASSSDRPNRSPASTGTCGPATSCGPRTAGPGSSIPLRTAAGGRSTSRCWRLFGGVSEPAFAAYDETWPLADGHEDRVALYQLYPLLVHTVLFDGGYSERVVAAARYYK